MKTLKSLAFALVFLFTAHLAQANNADELVIDALRTEIAKKLKSIDIQTIDSEEVSLQVNFLVNTKNELIILSTSNSDLDNTIKSRLNYRKLSTTGITKNKIYTLPVTLIK